MNLKALTAGRPGNTSGRLATTRRCWLQLPPSRQWGDLTPSAAARFYLQEGNQIGAPQPVGLHELGRLPQDYPLYCCLHPLDTVCQQLELPTAVSDRQTLVRQQQAAPWLLEPYLLSDPEQWQVNVIRGLPVAGINTLATPKGVLNNLLERLQQVGRQAAWVGPWALLLHSQAPCQWQDTLYRVECQPQTLPICVAHAFTPEAFFSSASAPEREPLPAFSLAQWLSQHDTASILPTWLRAANFLRGRYSQSGTSATWFTYAVWRRPLWLAASLVASYLLGLHAYAWQLERTSRQLTQQVQQAVQGVFPQLTVLYEPVEQVKKAVLSLQASRSATPLAATDLISFLSAAQAALQTLPADSLRAVQYTDAQLQLKLVATQVEPSQRQVLQQQWQSQGLQVTWGAQTGSEIIVTLRHLTASASAESAATARNLNDASNPSSLTPAIGATR
ncbi:type II secretion system protein GspL [Parvibium lacunae]|nr:type II secretion system protein GspL [Parvibium lacunae]